MFLDVNYNYNYNYSYSYSYSYSNRYKHKNKNKTISISIQLTWSGAAENGAFWRRVSPRHPTGAYALMDHIYILFFYFLLFSVNETNADYRTVSNNIVGAICDRPQKKTTRFQ